MKEENKETLEQAAHSFASSDPWSGDMNIYGGLHNGFTAGANWKAQQSTIVATDTNYTQEQMIAFGEDVKKKCVKEVKLKRVLNIVMVDKRSIMSVDISKLLKK